MGEEGEYNRVSITGKSNSPTNPIYLNVANVSTPRSISQQVILDIPVSNGTALISGIPVN